MSSNSQCCVCDNLSCLTFVLWLIAGWITMVSSFVWKWAWLKLNHYKFSWTLLQFGFDFKCCCTLYGFRFTFLFDFFFGFFLRVFFLFGFSLLPEPHSVPHPVPVSIIGDCGWWHLFIIELSSLIDRLWWNRTWCCCSHSGTRFCSSSGISWWNHSR